MNSEDDNNPDISFSDLPLDALDALTNKSDGCSHCFSGLTPLHLLSVHLSSSSGFSFDHLLVIRGECQLTEG